MTDQHHESCALHIDIRPKRINGTLKKHRRLAYTDMYDIKMTRPGRFFLMHTPPSSSGSCSWVNHNGDQGHRELHD